jgi:mono/diheme cytochrome c family protein
VLLALTGYELALLGVAAVFVAFALIVALVIPRSRPDFPGKSLWLFVAICVGLFAAQLTAVFVDASHVEHAEAAETHPPTTPSETETTETETTTETTETTTETTEAETTTEPEGEGGDPAAGKEVFLGTAACGSCHALADAGTEGTIGPSLDATKPSYDKVVERVTNGQGIMPPFSGQLSEQEIQDVAAYVSSVAGT